MNIGEAAKKAGINAKMLRHYESIGVIPKASRSDSGYRIYSDTDVHILKFVKRARSLGFSMVDTKKLVGLWKNRSRSSSDVKKLALSHIDTLEKKQLEIDEVLRALRGLARNCRGDNRPDCPILNDLAG